MAWKGLILAGGTGSRLFPLTQFVNKHLLPVYDKPMIYYPLTTMMLGGIRDFVIVSLPDVLYQFEQTLGNGEQWGVSFEYVAQPEPKGIADGFVVAREQLDGHNVALILGDNIFYGTGLPDQIRRAISHEEGATIFGYEVSDPSAFGVVEIDQNGRPIHIEEKPKKPRSRLAIPGLYFFDKDVLQIASGLKPSARGEVEITDVINSYMDKKILRLFPMGRGTAWLDGGTHHDLFEANQFVKVLEERTGLKIASPEEVAFRMGYIDANQLRDLASKGANNSYYEYLLNLANSPPTYK